MKLSVLLPTYRHSLLACSRIAQVCSWAGPEVEVIVRDNSGNAEKRARIARFARDNCTIISVDPCGPRDNYTEALRLAKGEFIFCLGDDDLFFDRAVAALPGVIEQHIHNPNVVGVTGNYLVETSRGSAMTSYPNIDSDDVTARIAGYLSNQGPNALMYSPHRRSMVERVFRFFSATPTVSYHDQLTCLLYLLTGKFVRLPNVLYGYDMGPWEEMRSAQQQDVNFYKAAALDPAINKLHWFLCGFEGAILIRNSDMVPAYPAAQRQAMADQWFSAMFKRFLVNPRFAFDSPLTAQADALCARLRASQGRLSFVDMLSDICHFIALFSEPKAQAYLRFWGAALSPRKAAAARA